MKKLGIKETSIRLLPIFLVSIILIVFSIVFNNGNLSTKKVLDILYEAVAAGFLEELVFRKIILGKLLKKNKKSYLKYIFIVGIGFGLVHFINITDPEYDLISVITQVLSASVAGIMFGFVYYHTNSFLLCAITHTIYDIGAMLSTQVFSSSSFLEDILSNSVIMIINLIIIISFFVKNKTLKNILILFGVCISFLMILFLH